MIVKTPMEDPNSLRDLLLHFENDYVLPAKKYLKETYGQSPMATTTVAIFGLLSIIPVAAVVAATALTVCISMAVLVAIALSLSFVLSVAFVSSAITAFIWVTIIPRLVASLSWGTQAPSAAADPIAEPAPVKGRLSWSRRARIYMPLALIGEAVSRFRLPRVIRYSLVYRTLLGEKLFGPQGQREHPLQFLLALPYSIFRQLASIVPLPRAIRYSFLYRLLMRGDRFDSDNLKPTIVSFGPQAQLQSRLQRVADTQRGFVPDEFPRDYPPIFPPRTPGQASHIHIPAQASWFPATKLFVLVVLIALVVLWPTLRRRVLRAARALFRATSMAFTRLANSELVGALKSVSWKEYAAVGVDRGAAVARKGLAALIAFLQSFEEPGEVVAEEPTVPVPSSDAAVQVEVGGAGEES
ncbi:hypothetical protein HMN09_01289400 [Mycena chlorophos]|uniref:Uncharacterized protein n=1 Tax=Mycena chlorophos TaxID=658473 RepID=A0A8H6RZS6_MYCCL|nr:hypothetical protein HMN09_01289400 [Mycena chlorophos]